MARGKQTFRNRLDPDGPSPSPPPVNITLFPLVGGMAVAGKTFAALDSGDTTVTLTQDDLNYLGSYIIPTPSVGAVNGTGGVGLALRYESSDTTNPVHLMATSYATSTTITGTHRIKLKMRGTLIELYADTGSGYGVNPVCSVVDGDVTAAGKACTVFSTNYAIDSFVATNAAGGAFATDTFTAANGTTLTGRTLSGGGGTWSRHPSTVTSSAEVQGNAAQLVAGNTDAVVYVASNSPTNADYDVEANLIFQTYGFAGLAGRYDPVANTGYSCGYFTNGSGPGSLSCWVISKAVAGVATELARAVSGGTGYMANLFEWRDATPTNPASPTLSSSYGYATMMREYGNIFGPGYSTRTDWRNVPGLGLWYYDLSDGQAGTLRSGSIGYDSTNDHLYWSFTETYSNDDSVHGFGYSALDYATGGSTAYGPWRIDVAWHKAVTGGFVELPDDFIAAASLGTQRMAAVGSRPGSLAASGHQSVGPALTSFTPPVGVTPRTDIAGTRLVGYSPASTVPPPLKPNVVWFQGTGSADVIPYSAFDSTHWWLYDSTFGGVFIQGATKSGYLTVQRLAKGQATYLYASNTVEMLVNALSIVAVDDMVDVALGSRTPQSLQPDTNEWTWPVMDPTDYQSVHYASIATVTSVYGNYRSGQNHVPGQANAIVTTTAPHGFTVDGYVAVEGVSSRQYNDNWVFTVIDSTHLGIFNPSLDSYIWDGTTGTGGELRSVGHGDSSYNGIFIWGLAYDPATQKLYLGYRHKDGTPMVSVWYVDC